MLPTTQIEPRSPSTFTSGYGVVMEKEQALQSSIGRALGTLGGLHAAAVGRILRNQHARLGTNIALLEHRYQSLPHPERFQALHRMLSPLSKTRRVVADPEPEMLPALVAQHRNLTTSIDKLLVRDPDVQRGEVNLAEVAQNHDEMAWMLTALIKESETVRDRPIAPIDESPRPGFAEKEWENEGGALSPGPSLRRNGVVET